MSLSVRITRPSAPAPGRRSWPLCGTPRSTSADWPATPTSPPPNAATAGHPAQPSKRSPQHDQRASPQVRAIPDLAMPLGYGGCASRVRPVWARNPSMSSGRYLMRLSSLLALAARLVEGAGEQAAEVAFDVRPHALGGVE